MHSTGVCVLGFEAWGLGPGALESRIAGLGSFVWLQNDRQDSSPTPTRTSPRAHIYHLHSSPIAAPRSTGNWKRNRILEFELRHSVSSQRSVGQKWHRGSIAYTSDTPQTHTLVLPAHTPAPSFLGGAARWGARWLKLKLYFQGVLLHIAGCLNFVRIFIILINIAGVLGAWDSISEQMHLVSLRQT